MQYNLNTPQWGEAQAGRIWSQDMAIFRQRQIVSHDTAMHDIWPGRSTSRSSSAAVANASRGQDDGEPELKALLAVLHT